ncbi:MAG: DUF3445 domain-containing protein [Actinomycetia bacterium]|nr:DUF3445 domain-containing protein [Actinomycetes bacterium]
MSAEHPRRSYDWLYEIDLDPDRHWRYMGTRALGQRPWLVVDDQRDAELVFKSVLLTDRHDEVFIALPGTEDAGQEALDLIVGTGPTEVKASAVEAELTDSSGAELHPLDIAGRLVQEDLCLLNRTSKGWVLSAGSVCFPSSWSLAERVGHTLLDVHAPVEGYSSDLVGRVDRLFDRSEQQVIWRRNWFLDPDPRLFQPGRPESRDRVVAAPDCLSGLYLRSERQTFRLLPRTGYVLFTIRTQQHALGRLLDDGSRRDAFTEFVRQAPIPVASHRGVCEQQRRELRLALSL